MQKTLDILEKNVQWFALGLGGIFLLWVVWSYVITPPATVTMDRKTFGPGEVAEYTANGPVRDIQNQIDSEKQVAPIQVADVVGPWKTQMEAVNAPQLPVAWAPQLTHGPTGPIDHPPTPGNPTGLIAAVPQLPKAQPTQSQSGLSVVQLPGQKNNGGNAQAAADEARDLPWVSETFVIPASALKAAFEAPLNGQQPPAGVYNTTLLQVVLQRQRAAGIDANNQPTFPQGDQGVEDVPEPATVKDQIQPLPGPSSDVGTKYGYVDWAQKNFELLAQPPFYDVKGGDPYTSPTALPAAGTPAAAPAAAPPPAAPAPATPPATAPNNNPRDLFGKPRTQANSPSGFAFTDDAMDRRRDRGNRGNFGNANPGFGAFGGRGANNGPANGLINPLNLTTDLQIWAHDDSAKPGETYRYRVVYKMKNPLFNTQNIATKQVSQEFLLVSPPSDWTQPVAVPKMTKFWVNAYRRDGALLDIYDWKGGKWNHTSKLVSPGDPIPGTDWTLVDVRGNTGGGMDRDKYVLLTDDSGSIVRRSVQTDAADPDYKATDASTKAPAATNNNVRPGRPGRNETPDQRRPGRTPGRRT